VRLIDFGLAIQVEPRSLAAGHPADRACGSRREVVGTLDYAAPEQLGQLAGVAIGPYSDVYGFGKTCYYTLLGTAKPTEEETANLAAPWRELLAGCTGWNARDRYADCSPLLAHLAKMQAKSRSERRRRRAVAYLQTAQTYSDDGDLERALADLTRALQLNPKLATAYNNRGVIHSQRGELARAIADFSAALRLDPQVAEVYHNRGLAYATQGAYPQAIEDFTRALALNPWDAVTYHFRGMAHGNQGDLDSAIADFTEAIRLNPEDPLPYRHRGAAYAKKGWSALAECDYQAALRLEPALSQECAG